MEFLWAVSACKRMQSLLPTIHGLWPPGQSVSDLDPLPLDVQPGSWLLEENDKSSHQKSEMQS